MTPWTQISDGLREPESPDDSENTELGVPGFPSDVPCDSGSRNQPELRHPELTRSRNPGILGATDPGTRSHSKPRVSGITRNCGFPKSPFRNHPELGHTELRFLGFTRSSGFPESPGNSCSRNQPELRGNPELRVFGVTRNFVLPHDSNRKN